MDCDTKCIQAWIQDFLKAAKLFDINMKQTFIYTAAALLLTTACSDDVSDLRDFGDRCRPTIFHFAERQNHI